KLLHDGMRYNSLIGNGTARGYYVNSASAQEIVIETGAGGSAEYETGGVHLNVVPRDGGNRFSAFAFGSYTNDNLQSNNLTDQLRAQGLTSVNQSNLIYDGNGSVGGPIKSDKLWFYTAHRRFGSTTRVANLYHMLDPTPNSFNFTPDRSRPADSVD